MSSAVDVATLGEALIVMDPCARGRLRNVRAFEKRVGGAELNVAVALARLGHRTAFAGCLGDDEFGREIVALLRGEGVDVAGIRHDSRAPTGLYFKERRSLDALRVHYYRAGSAASRQRFDDIDLAQILDTRVLHLTGITPALSPTCRELAERLAEAAVQQGVLLSVDANLRWRLLGDRDAADVVRPLLERADLLFLATEEADVLLGGSDEPAVRRAMAGLRAQTVVVHAADAAFALEESGATHAPAFPVSVVDTVGAGDAFVAGFLSGRLRDWPLGECLRLANACGACAVTVPGDVDGMPDEEEALALMGHGRERER